MIIEDAEAGDRDQEDEYWEGAEPEAPGGFDGGEGAVGQAFQEGTVAFAGGGDEGGLLGGEGFCLGSRVGGREGS